MWAARALKRPADKDNTTSLCRAESKKLDAEPYRSFVTLSHHPRLVVTIQVLGRYTFMDATGLLESVILQARYPKGRDGTQQDGRYLRNL